MGTKTIHVTHITGGDITITTGGSTPSEPTAPNGKVLYKTSADGEWLESENIYISDGGFNGFDEYDSAVAVILPSKDSSGNDITGIEVEALRGLTNLTNITIPDSVTNIKSYAFADCTGLTSITIPSSVTTFGDGIIQGCDNLHTINLPGRTLEDVEYLT